MSRGSVSVFDWDIDGDGTPDGFFRIGDIGNSTIAGPTSVGIAPVSSAGASSRFVQRFDADDTIDANLSFIPGGGLFGGFKSSVSMGLFLSNTGYAGFAASDLSSLGSGPFYGWVKVHASITLQPLQGTLTVFEWAYDDSGAPIRVGDTGAVPAPTTALLTLLGLGALGVQAYRRRREEGLKRLADEQDAAAA
jgi:hypothetical protein